VRVRSNSIWIHRFYDVSASTWSEKPQDYSLERAAEDLLLLIEKLEAKTGAPRIYLVAHSMGSSNIGPVAESAAIPQNGRTAVFRTLTPVTYPR